MIEVYVLALALAIAAAVLVLLAVISLGIRREEAAYTMTEPTADPVARCARVANGVYVRIPGVAKEVRQDLLRMAGQEVMTR